MHGDDGNTDTNNPFIRFRHHVDTNIHAGINTITNNFSRSHPSSSPDTTTTTAGTTDTTPNMDSTKPNTDLTTRRNPTMTMLSESEQHIESRLALLSHGGATLPESALAWRLFLTRSAYSPLRLQREADSGGWQPVPGDLVTPRHYHHHFSSSKDGRREVYDGYDGYEGYDGSGWLDAFEDLMRVSSGLGVADLRAKAREEEREGFGFGGFGLGGFNGFGFGFGLPSSSGWPHPHHQTNHGMVGFGFPGLREMAWLERMRRQGLTEVLFPVYDPGLGCSSPRTMAEWVERRRAEEQRTKEAGRAWEEFVGERRKALEDARREAEREADTWAEEFRREVDSWRDAARETGPSFFDGISGAVRTLGKVLEDEIKGLQQFGKEDEKRRAKDDAATEKKDRAPETENDLYSVIQSAFHESERSLSNFFKTFSEARRRGDNLSEPTAPPKTETTEVVEDGITKKTTKREFVDDHGNRHSKTETTWTDKDGRVVMMQAHSSMGRSEHWGKTEEEPIKEGKEAVSEHKEQKKEGGWFWK